MDERSARAWTERMAVRPLGEGRYAVDSQSGATYVVDLPAGTCSCPDHLIRGQRCKHLRRTAIEVNEGRVPPPGRARADCSVCGRTAFVPEDESVPVCDDCRLERGDRVVDRETGDVLVVARVTDERAADVEIPAAGSTVAAYPTNRDYDPEDVVVEAVYPRERVRARADGRDPRRYSFPRSRLRRARGSDATEPRPRRESAQATLEAATAGR